MMDVVIVPCYERPEYTFLCLVYLSRARGITDKEVWLCQDQHKDGPIVVPFMTEVLAQAEEYIPHIKYRLHETHNTYGNSKNLIDSLKDAFDTGAERVFLVEDDIIVAPDIFEWHEAVLDEVGVFVSCATGLNKSAHFQINGPQAMDEGYHDPSAYLKVCGPYSSHAAAFKREKLGFLLGYIEGQSSVPWAPGHEQDLVTQKYLRTTKWESAWPYAPRAYNVGWRSYHINTGSTFNGALQQKVRALENTIRDPQKLKEMSANNSAVTLLPEKWPVRLEPVRNVQRFR